MHLNAGRPLFVYFSLFSALFLLFSVCNGKRCQIQKRWFQRVNSLHKICNRATPDQLMLYKLALALHKLYNVEFNPIEFIILNFNQILTGCQENFISLKSNSFKVGIIPLSNRLHLLNNKIPLSWLNLSLCSFKIKCKKLLLSNWFIKTGCGLSY